jgi:hypothetical protein
LFFFSLLPLRFLLCSVPNGDGQPHHPSFLLTSTKRHIPQDPGECCFSPSHVGAAEDDMKIWKEPKKKKKKNTKQSVIQLSISQLKRRDRKNNPKL